MSNIPATSSESEINARIRRNRSTKSKFMRRSRSAAKRSSSFTEKRIAKAAKQYREPFKIVEFFCFASSYNLQGIKSVYEQCCYEAYFLDQACHILYLETNFESLVFGTHRSHAQNRIREKNIDSEVMELFIFHNGPIVIWNVDERKFDDSRNDLNIINRNFPFVREQKIERVLFACFYRFTDNPTRREWSERDQLQYCYISDLSPNAHVPTGRVKNNCVFLKTRSVPEKLAISFALSQSIRLDVYEASVSRAVNQIKEIPQKMAEVGGNLVFQSVPMLKGAVGDIEVIGQIVDVNLVEDFLDVPEYFWENDEWQYFWERMHKWLELEERIALLNKRFECIKEILFALRNEATHAHESRLSWIVIIFIALQICVVFVKILLRAL